jgi:hypothetical protein
MSNENTEDGTLTPEDLDRVAGGATPLNTVTNPQPGGDDGTPQPGG